MATWNKAILTDDGRKLQAKVEAGTKLVFTKMAMGAGKPSDLKTASQLADKKIDMQIASVDTSMPYTVTIYGVLSNAKLEKGFTATELGLYAQDPDIGEILYMVVTDSKPDYIPDQTNVIMQRVGIGVSFSNTEQVIVDFAGSGFITSDDARRMINNELEKHRKKKPLDHPDQSVQSRHLEDGSVLTSKLQDYAVTTQKIGADAVTDGKIGKRTIDDAFSDFKDTNDLSGHLSGLGAQVKNITGESKWSARPLINLKKTKEEIDLLKQNKLDASVVGRDSGKIPTLNTNGKWDASLLPPMDYVPNSKIGRRSGQIPTLNSSGKWDASLLPPMNYIATSRIGTGYGDIATLDWNGRYSKSRLPSDLVYTSDFHTSSGSNGYTTMAGGFMIQWGMESGLTDTGYDGSVTVQFPTAFPTACFVVLACPNYDRVTEGGGVIYAKKIDRYSCKLTLDGIKSVSSMDAFWIALGY